MFEEDLTSPNQDETIDSEEGLFDDYEVEDSPVETEETVEEPQTEEVSTDTVTEPFLNIRYNKEDIALTRDEAIELAQKGKNYDKVFEQYNSLNSTIEGLARQNGMTREAYLQNLNEMQNRYQMNREVQQLRNQYPDADDDLLKEVAQNRINSRMTQQIQQQEAANTNEQNEVRRQLDMFRSHYPNLEVDKLAPEVYENVKQGYTLLEAYSLWREKAESKTDPKAELQLKQKARNEVNRRKSVGNIGNSASDENDDFLNGFLG